MRRGTSAATPRRAASVRATPLRRFPAGDDAVAPVDVMGGRSCSRTRVVVQENLLVDHDERSVQAVSFNYLRAGWKVSPRAVPPCVGCRMAGCVLHAHAATDNNTPPRTT